MDAQRNDPPSALSVTAEDDHLYAAVVLARDIKACQALLRGIPVPRHRLMPGVLVDLEQDPQLGPPIRLTDELAARIELTSPSPRDHNWAYS